MSQRWQEQNGRDGGALAGSLLFHALFLAFLMQYAVVTHENSLDSIETISFEKIQHVTMQRKHVPAASRAAAVVARTPQSTHIKKPSAAHAAKPSPPPSTKSRFAKSPQPPGSQAQPIALAQQVGSPGPEVAKPAQTAAAPVSSPAPAAQDKREQRQQVATTTGTTNGGGNGIFLSNDEQAPVLDANASSELKRRFRMNLTLIVLVSDDGKTKDIQFQPPASADIEKQIRDLLASAHWDAAQCGGGIACEGKATIKLFQ